MKTHECRRRGFTLIECLVYLGVFGVLLGLGFLGLYQCIENMQGVRRDSDDIVRALHAGELWRADVRSATRPIQWVESNLVVRIPHRQGEVFYKFAEGEVCRKAGPGAPWIVLLPKVEHSQMEADPRGRVIAWRWELELQTPRKAVPVRPVFSFLAVPGAPNSP